MPAFLAAAIAGLWAAFSRLLATRLGQWIATAAFALGINFVTSEAVIEPVKSLVIGALGGVPAAVAQWAGVMNFDKYLTIILSAYAAGGIKRAIMVRRSA